MAEETELERTEPASPRRLEQARERGQVPRSPELSTFAVLLAAGGGLLMMGSALVESLMRIMRAGLTVDRVAAFDTSQLAERLYQGASAALMGFLPLFAVVVAVAILAPALVSGWLFTFQAVQPDFSRLNPLWGLKRILSWYGALELAKAVLKTLVIGGVAVWAVWAKRAEMASLVSEPLETGLAHLGELLGFAFLAIAGAFAAIVALDVPFQIWDHRRQLRMTPQEARAELRETEGDPRIKDRIRRLQREVARRRMMAELPRAAVVVSDPGRQAVALKYTQETMRAPRVVAKGAMLVADRIVEMAGASGVPVLRAAPLARALFSRCEVGEEIPGALYDTVAEALAWAYQVRRFEAEGGEPPREPAALAVPPQLDPGAAPS
jgi:flagellar biosynthetic protein FlhB